jgi:hypothetical protein
MPNTATTTNGVLIVARSSEKLRIETITKLTDAAGELFRLLYAQEGRAKAAAKERLRRALMDMDVFANSTTYEEPDDWRSP